MAKLVDVQVSEACAFGCGSSSLPVRTDSKCKKAGCKAGFFCFYTFLKCVGLSPFTDFLTFGDFFRLCGGIYCCSRYS